MRDTTNFSVLLKSFTMRLPLLLYLYWWLVACTYLSANPVSAIGTCGGFPYHPHNQTCCGGRIHVTPVELGATFRCCGDDLYPLDGTWECCGNTKMELTEDTMCCNNEIIDSSTHECCGNRYTVQQKHQKQEGYECCGTAYYDRESQTCCSNEHYFYGISHRVADGLGSCCGSQTYDASSEICCRLPTGGRQSFSVGEYGVMLQETECCGDGWINKTTHICCRGVRQPRENGPTQCYGTQAYDPTKQVVCNNRLQDIHDGKTECCNENLINPNEEPCCNNPDLLERSPFSCCGFSDREVYDPTESSCINYDSKVSFPEIEVPKMLWGQCGRVTYATTLHICCGDQLAPKFEDSFCCGAEPYRSNSQFCINETESIVVDKIIPNAAICTYRGRDIDLQYDPQTQTCCRESDLSEFWRVFNGTDGECCQISYNEVILTDPRSQTCCKVPYGDQKVHATPEGEGECCGPEMLINGTQLCDISMQEVVDIPENHPNHNDVCVPKHREHNNIRQTYDNRKEFCSDNGEIIPRTEGKGLCNGKIYDTATHSCCGPVIYRQVTHQCCNDNVQPLLNDDGLPLECCGVQAYHSGTSTCVRGTILHDLPEANARYCGSTLYDNSRYDCVDGEELVPQEAGPHIGLCGRTKKVYDKTLLECCGDDLIGPGQTCCHDYKYNTPGTPLKGGKCCGATGYNPSTHRCCIGNISPIHGMEEPACCMHQAYDRTVSDITCCGGRLSRKAPDETECSVTDKVVHRPDEIVCNGVRHPAGHGQCCGSDLYNPTTELCCGGFKYKAGNNEVCCGNKPYQNTSDGSLLCCDGTLHTQAEGKECCNRAAFYPATHQCFTTGGQNIVIELLDNTPSATDAFCTEGSYDPTNQTCCDGLLYNGLRECCGNRVIENPSEFMCCNEVIRFKMYNDASICCPSGQIMHESTGCDASHQPDYGYQLCNDTRFFPVTQGCCAGAIYSVDEAQCRDGQVFFLCGDDQFYSKEEQTCCNGSLTDIPNGECCENTAFDPTSSICCEGNLRRIIRGRDQCCGVLAFDVRREMCCESGPVRMPRISRKFKSKMEDGLCCGDGFEPNFQTRRCEAVPLICMGLERGNLWKEAADDCSKDFTFSFTARHIDTNDTRTVIEMAVVLHLLSHNANVQLDTLVLPDDVNCRKLKEHESYVVISSGDVENRSLHLRSEDFIGKNHPRIGSKLLRRTCY